MKSRYKLWREWAKYNTNNKLYQFMVLFGIAKSPTFEVHKEYYGKFGYGSDLKEKADDKET